MIRSLTRTQLVVDIVAACVFLLLVIWVPVVSSPVLGTLVVLLSCAALAVRRLSPALALVGIWAASLLQLVTLQSASPVHLAVLAVLYATACYGGRIVRWLGLASAGVGGLIAAIYLSTYSSNGFTIPGGDFGRWLLIVVVLSVAVITLLALSWTLGLLARTVRQSREAKVQAAAAAQRAAYESAIEQERTRIARDMHDVVAHSLAVVIAQADGARYAGADRPEVQADALGTISATARSALTEVRLLLTRLRQEVPDGPQPSLDDMPALIAGMRRAGLRVTESTSGAPLPLLHGTGIAAYRILQEALTNALRHGDLAHAVTVDVRWRPESVRITVRNAMRSDAATPSVAELAASAPGNALVGARAHAAGSTGHGLPGMRERAALACGTLTAGVVSGPSAMYEVIAELPTATVGSPADQAGERVL